MFQDKIAIWVFDVLKEQFDLKDLPKIDFPADQKFGDYSINLGLTLAKKIGKNPTDLAKEIAGLLDEKKIPEIAKIEVAGAGFVNFFLTDEFLWRQAEKTAISGPEIFPSKNLFGKKIVIEYTDPNPFKEFHIGHLMTNTIGEALARIFILSGAKITKVCYQGDVGAHVAKAIYVAIVDKKAGREIDWRTVYQRGAEIWENDLSAKKEIEEINKKIYNKDDSEINEVYEEGKKWSLDNFEKIYKILGTEFDHYFFESEMAKVGMEVVKNNLGEIFKESDGAIIFPGEEYGLHNRVFVNSVGLPTYEAKELGLAQIKAKIFPADSYLVVTGNEINEYFKVLKKALSFIDADLSEKIEHLGHGMLRLPSGKMSSRAGKVITVESLISDVSKLVFEKIKTEDFKIGEKEKIAEQIAVGAIKYMVLKQQAGNDIIFDFEKSVSFEGESGPYLMYSYARALSVLTKGNLSPRNDFLELNSDERCLAVLIGRLNERLLKSAEEKSPHYLAQYLLEFAGAFNRFYANNMILNSKEFEAGRLVLVGASVKILEIGLQALSLPV